MSMVIFEETQPGKGETTGKAAASGDEKSAEVKHLEDELQYTKESLQATNEELEASREELQSLNEESVTVNSELQARIEQLTSTRDDVKNLLEASEIAVIFLDSDQNIRRFTSKVTEIFPLTPSDTGRPIKHFASNLKDVALGRYIQKVLNDLAKVETEVRDNKGKTYRMQVRPFRTVNNVIDGVVITFVNITDLKILLDKAKRLAAIVKDSNDAITLQDLEGNIIAWNRGAEKMFGYSEAEALKKNIFDLIPPAIYNEIRELLSGLTSDEGEKLANLVTERLDKEGKVIPVWLSITTLMDENNRPQFIATTERDLNMINQKTVRIPEDPQP
jgi:two-component system CheB/CheR fusion protein